MDCMCRVCETIYGLKNMFDEENEELLLMLRSVANISIFPNDLLPKYICEFCSHKLQKSYEFKVQCEATDQKLREIIEHLTKTNIVPVEEKPDNRQPVIEKKKEIKQEIETVATKRPPTKPQSSAIVIVDSEDEETMNNFDNMVSDECDEFSEEDEKEKMFEEEMKQLFGNVSILHRKQKSTVIDTVPEISKAEIEAKLDAKIHAKTSAKVDAKLNAKVPEPKVDPSITYQEIIINGENIDDLIIEDYSEDFGVNESTEGVNESAEGGENLETKSEVASKEERTVEFESVIDSTDKVEDNDYLPKHICEACESKLREAFHFIEQCENTDKKLRETLESIEQLTSDDETKDINLSLNLTHELNYEPRKTEIQPSTSVEACVLETETAEDYIIVEEPSEDYENEEIDFFCVEDSKSDSYTKEENEENSEEEWPSDAEIQLKVEKSDFEIGESSNEDEIFGNFIEEDAEQSELELSSKTKVKTPSTSKTSSSTSKSVGQKVFACNSCTETFTNFNELNAHKKNHGEKRFECPTCSKRFSRHYRLRDHMLTHGEPLKLPCSLCDKTYTNRGNLERHIRHCHNKEKPHSCEICGWSFARKATLRLHRAVHSDAREYECDKCGKKFKAEYYLNVHKKSHIPIELRKTKRPKQKRKLQICICPYCGKKSSTQYLHVNHLRTHTGEKPFECPTCSKRFTFKQSLKTHMLVHTGEKPFACDICGMTFRQIGHLQGHKLAVHSGLKQHKCLYCDKSFALRSNLTIHERLHTGEKPYECSICSKRFNDTNGLKRHKISHARNGQVEPMNQEQSSQERQEGLKPDDTGDLNQIDVSLDQLNVYLDELGNEYTEIIETENTLEIVS